MAVIFFSSSLLFFKKWTDEKKVRQQLLQDNMQLQIVIQGKDAEKSALERLLEEHKNLKFTFKAIAEETLDSTQGKWLVQAEKQFKEIYNGMQHDLEKKDMKFSHLVEPVKATLGKLEEKLQLLQKEKHGQDQVFQAQLEKLTQQEAELAKETKALVSALKNSSTRGFWGEISLKRLVELAGLVQFCDFYEQHTINSEDILRPDLVVRLPNQRYLVVDAKVPLSAYLQAQEETHEDKKQELLVKHAKQIRSHIQALSKKSYFEKFSLSPEFVILFLPVDRIYQVALEADPELIEYSAQSGVILSTPMSLIGLLKSIHYAWKQEAISLNAKAISEQGEDLLKSIVVAFEHLEKVGRSLNTTVQSYNQLIGSMETRFIPKAKKLSTYLGKEGEEIKTIASVEKVAREINLSDSISV